jgi:endonuclease/exonuclease/phosphatase family metal-dependent hydrolase
MFWNIQHGGGPRRTPELILACIEQAPDVLVLAEFHAGSPKARGNTWHGPLVDAGLSHIATASSLAAATASDAPPRNALLVASRFPLTVREPCSRRLLAVQVKGEQHTVQLLAAHIPSEEAGSARAAHYQAAAQWAKEHSHAHALLVGDLNTSRRGLDLPREGQRNEAQLGELWTQGLRDVWHAQQGDRAQASWIGPKGEKHRIDTALATLGLLAGGVSMRYEHAPETTKNAEKLSDHAAIVLELFCGSG